MATRKEKEGGRESTFEPVGMNREQDCYFGHYEYLRSIDRSIDLKEH